MSQPAVEQLVRPEILALRPYAVDSAAGLIKLDAMENPYAWPADMKAAWLESLAGVSVNRYPDPAAVGLKQRLRESLELPGDRDLILGNGSDELIQMIVTALARGGGRVLTVTPTFVMYRRCAVTAGMICDEVQLGRGNFALDGEEMLRVLKRSPPAVVFLAYPNNPTGNLFDDGAVAAVVESARCAVVIDEAYEPFAGRSWLERVGRHEHVLVMRTLSKAGLAGLRLGYLVGSPAWIEQFEKVRLPYNIGVLTQHSADFALRHYDVLREQTARIRQQRDQLYRSMSELAGVHVWPSAANFLLFKTDVGATRIFEALRQRGILIKNLDNGAPLLRDCLRVTVSTPEENGLFLSALADTLADLR